MISIYVMISLIINIRSVFLTSSLGLEFWGMIPLVSHELKTPGRELGCAELFSKNMGKFSEKNISQITHPAF